MAKKEKELIMSRKAMLALEVAQKIEKEADNYPDCLNVLQIATNLLLGNYHNIINEGSITSTR